MTWFRSTKDEKLKQLLKNSDSNFRFDSNPGKYRLMSSIDNFAQKPAPHFRLTRVMKHSISFALVVIAISTTLAFAATSKPGDELFALNKLGENLVLQLPLSVEQKAQVQAYIVTSRLEALDSVKEATPNKPNLGAQARDLAAIKETDESFTLAVDQITKNQKDLEASGKTKSAQKLTQVLNDLQLMAQKREAKIQALEDATPTGDMKTQIQAHLVQLKTAREKAQAELRRIQNKSGDGEKDSEDNS